MAVTPAAGSITQNSGLAKTGLFLLVLSLCCLTGSGRHCQMNQFICFSCFVCLWNMHGANGQTDRERNHTDGCFWPLSLFCRFWEMAFTFTGLKLQGSLGRFGKTSTTDIEGYAELPDGKVSEPLGSSVIRLCVDWCLLEPITCSRTVNDNSYRNFECPEDLIFLLQTINGNENIFLKFS